MKTSSYEQFDIYDAEGRPIGTASRTEAHAKGYWHRTFQCWVWERTEQGVRFLFQERHPDKDTFPGLLDISCAGHLLAGETIEEGIRELSEELGVVLRFDDLTPCGVAIEEDLLDDGRIDREFCHVFLWESNRSLTDYILQPDEVTGLYSLDWVEVERLARGQLETIRIPGVALDQQGQLRAAERWAAQTDFVPHSEAYFRMVLDKLKEIMKGK